MKKIAFTVADRNNELLLKGFVNSLRKFHSEEELPLVIIGQEQLDKISDPFKFYRMTPMVAKDLLTKADLVIKMDCDQIVTGKLDELWEGEYDVGVVKNWNPTEPPYTVWDIHPLNYFNCGLVAMRSKVFVDHWWKQCVSDHFPKYQFREQDILNIILHYGNYTYKVFDDGDSFYGLASKGYWQYIEKRGDELILPKADRDWPVDGDRKIKVIHFAGGQDPNKANYRIRFKPDVVKYLDKLTHD